MNSPVTISLVDSLIERVLAFTKRVVPHDLEGHFRKLSDPNTPLHTWPHTDLCGFAHALRDYIACFIDAPHPEPTAQHNDPQPVVAAPQAEIPKPPQTAAVSLPPLPGKVDPPPVPGQIAPPPQTHQDTTNWQTRSLTTPVAASFSPVSPQMPWPMPVRQAHAPATVDAFRSRIDATRPLDARRDDARRDKNPPQQGRDAYMIVDMADMSDGERDDYGAHPAGDMAVSDDDGPMHVGYTRPSPQRIKRARNRPLPPPDESDMVRHTRSMLSTILTLQSERNAKIPTRLLAFISHEEEIPLHLWSSRRLQRCQECIARYLRNSAKRLKRAIRPRKRLTRADLLNLIKRHNVSGYSTLSNEDLRQELRARGIV